MGLFSKLLRKRKDRVEAGRACYAEAPTASPARVVKERKERGVLDRALHARSATTHAAAVETKKKKESIEVGRASYTAPVPTHAAKDRPIDRKRDSLFGEVEGDDEGKRWSVDVKEALEMKWNEVLAKAGASDDANRVVQDRRYSSDQVPKRDESKKKETGDRKSADAGDVFETKRSSRREKRRESSVPIPVDAYPSSGKEKSGSGTKERSRPVVPRRESSVPTRVEDQTMSGNGRSVSVYREKSHPQERTRESSAPTRVADQVLNGSKKVVGDSKERGGPVERSEKRRENSAQTRVEGQVSGDSARRSRARDSKRTSQPPVEKKSEKPRDRFGANSRSLPKDNQERDKSNRDQEKEKKKLKERSKQDKPPRSKWAELWTPEKVMDLAQEYKPKGREDPRVSAEFRGPPKYFFPTPRDSAEQSELDLRRLSANKRYSGDSFAGRRSSIGKARGDSWGPEQRDWDFDSFDIYQGKKDERSADSSDESIFYSVNIKRKA
jgi:hypothetical protein